MPSLTPLRVICQPSTDLFRGAWDSGVSPVRLESESEKPTWIFCDSVVVERAEQGGKERGALGVMPGRSRASVEKIMRIVAAAWVIVAVLGAPAWAQTAASKADLQAMMGDLEKNANAWTIGRPEDPAVEAKLKALTYDTQSVQGLKDVLTPLPGKDPKSLYITNKLLLPLLGAGPEVIRASLPVVREQVTRQRTIKLFPVYAPAYLAKQYGIPDLGKNVTVEAQLHLLDEVGIRRKKKVEAETLILNNNIQACLLGDTYCKLLLLAEDPKEDAVFLAFVQDADKRSSHEFITALTTLNLQAPKMSAERAKRLYSQMLKYAQGKKWERRALTQFDKGVVVPTANSTFELPGFHVGVELFKSVNALAAPAQEPVVAGPTAEDVDKYIAAHPQPTGKSP